jgi:hypothetical protein
MQSRSAHELNVVMTLSNLASGRLAHNSEGFDQEIIEGLTVGETPTEFDRSIRERLIGQRLGFCLERIDFRYQSLKSSDLLAFAGSEEFV